MGDLFVNEKQAAKTDVEILCYKIANFLSTKNVSMFK